MIERPPTALEVRLAKALWAVHWENWVPEDEPDYLEISEEWFDSPLSLAADIIKADPGLFGDAGLDVARRMEEALG